MPLTLDTLADIVTNTTKNFGEKMKTDLASALQRHVAQSYLSKNARETSGNVIQFNIRTGTSGNAAMTTPFATATTNRDTTLTTGSVPWRIARASAAWDLDEVAVNSDPHKVLDVVKEQIEGAMIDMAELMEAQFWTKPATSSNVTDLFGIQYWIVANSSEGFNGGDPSGFSAGAAGVATATYPRWKNYTGTYSTFDYDVTTGVISKVRRAAEHCNFRPIPDVNAKTYNSGNDWRLFCKYDTFDKIRRALEGANENLGYDIMGREPMVNGVPLTWVPYLAANEPQTNSIYGINFGEFRPIYLRGRKMVSGKPMTDADRPTVLVQYWHNSMNFVCYNRRAQFVLYSV